ncbi:MAG: hypothetical protein WC006_03030 [Bacilli bacterium]|nr:hypothetical protein [Bacilli bacterium]
MKIYGNQELLKLRNDIDALSKKFTSDLEMINNEFSPTFNSLKKRRSNIIYYIVMTLFLMLFITIAVVLKVLIALYLILILYGINLLLTGVGVFFLRKVNKAYLATKKEWDHQYEGVLTYQTRINQLYTLAEEEVYKTMALTLAHDELETVKDNKTKYNKLYENKIAEVKALVKKEIGSNQTSEAVVSYYVQWGDNLTNQNKSDYDYLEARRRKAQIRSGSIDIDSK